RADLREEPSARDVRSCGDADLIELSPLAEEPLRGREGEDRERVAGDRAPVAVHGDAGDRVAPFAASRNGDSDPVTDAKRLRVGRLRVDRDLAGTGRPATGGEPERAEALVGRVGAEAELRGAPARDHLPVPADDLGPGADRSAGSCHAGQAA